MMRTIYRDSTGPLVGYDGVFLCIEDLNPEIKTRWRMNRWEMVRLALSTFVVALLP